MGYKYVCYDDSARDKVKKEDMGFFETERLILKKLR